MLRKLKSLGAQTEELLDIYRQQVISILQLAVPVWTPGLTKTEVGQIERVQKVAMHIIMGENFQDYRTSLKTLKLKTLAERREDICEKFAKKSYLNPNFKHWFENSDRRGRIQTRQEKSILKPVFTRTARYENSPLPYLTKLLNKCKWTEEEKIFM